MSEIRFDGVAVLIAIGVTALTLIGFGLFPALRHSRVDATEVLRGGPGQSTGRSSRRAMEWLVRGQIALAALILCDAALVGESLLRLQRADLAFAPEHVMVAELALQAGAFDSLPKQIELLDRLVPALAAIPGVVEASPVVAAPFSGAFGWDARLAVEGETPAEAQRRLMLNVDVVDTGYFHALGIATLEGRTFSGTDRENALPVVVLSRSAARQYWPGKAPLGQRVALDARGGRWFTVVGIVADTRYRDLREPRASVYFPLHQSPFPFAPTTLAIRTAGAPEFMVPTIRRTIQSSAAGVTVARAEPMSVLLRAPLVQPRLNTLLLMLFATAAVTLAAVGLFGVMATMVRQRTKEIAIRVAIGATPGSVRAMILRQGVRVAAVGTIAGCLLAFATIPALGDLLYGSSATDAVISAAVIAVVLGVIAAAATLAPAIYATRVDPAAALRVDA